MEKILIANWKLHPLSEREAVRIAKVSDSRNVVIAPPFPFLRQVKNVLKKASLGAQDVFYENTGMYTGEISPLMLKNFGVSYVIIGHSERRTLGETDEMIAKKARAALQAKLKVILCIGEQMSIKRKGPAAVGQFIEKQIHKGLEETINYKLITNNLLIAYEPIWAIGARKSASSKDTVEIARFVHTLLFKNYKLQTTNYKFLYGGSVNSKNIAGFLSQKEIDGVLVGGTSIIPSEMRAMIKIANSK